MDYKNVFDRVGDQGGFIKGVEASKKTRPSIDSNLKAALNRKGNALYNSGDIEGARRVFLTTGYSDGLARVGDFYKAHGRPLDALRMYWIAPDKTKADLIFAEIAGVIQGLIHEKGEEVDE
jgi:hypothetical protein